jgi:hypothetical protein
VFVELPRRLVVSVIVTALGLLLGQLLALAG